MQWSFWFRRRRWEQRMDAELRFHLESQMETYIAEGMTREEAARRARVDFGTLDLTKEECRDERPVQWLDHTWRDFQYASRSLLRTPGFTLAAILTLMLGIGANTAIFSAVHSALLRALPYHQPDQIYSVEIVIPARAKAFASFPSTIQAFLEWRNAKTAFTDVTALRSWECNLTGDGEPERLGGARVAANFFTFLGQPVAIGRGFAREEETPGKEKVVVISNALWTRRYGGDPSVIGRSIDINGERHLVIGVATAALLVPVQTQLHPLLTFAPRVDIWKPIAPTQRELAGESWDYGVLARLGAGQQPNTAGLQLTTLFDSWLRAKYPGVTLNPHVELKPIREVYSGRIRMPLLLLLAASGLLLLTACANIMNLFLARAASRSAEFATRIALGAGRGRILSQMIAETMVVALCGGTAGTVIAILGTRKLASFGPDELQTLSGGGPAMNPMMLLFALTVSVLAAMACGVIPAWNTYRNETVSGLRGGSRSVLGSGIRTRQWLVGVQIALGTVLLTSAGLLLHSFVKVMGADRGYSVERVMAVELSLFGQRQDAARFYGQLTDNVRSLPGVQAAAVINDLPAKSGSTGASRVIFYPGDTDFQGLALKRPVAMIRSVTSGYFAASGTVLRAGRAFAEQEPSPVAVISESLARGLWPAERLENVIGRALRQGDVKGQLITVVGVIQDVRSGTVERDLPPFIYRPYPQWASGPATLVVRTAQDTAELAPAVRAEIRKLNPNLPIPAMRTMREIVSESVAQRKFQVLLTALFALIALLLGAVGVFGVVSYAIACRTREIGLRLALGATREAVLRWMFQHGMRPVLAGIAVGVCGAIAAASLLRGLLYGVTPFDPISLGGVVVLLLICSGIACYLPARRAAKLDPMTALRCE